MCPGRFVRYEKKEDMKAALRGYQDGSLRYLQPEWLQCNVCECPSNSHFEVIVRDVPADISDVSTPGTWRPNRTDRFR